MMHELLTYWQISQKHTNSLAEMRTNWHSYQHILPLVEAV